jgi:hypothetical protein
MFRVAGQIATSWLAMYSGNSQPMLSSKVKIVGRNTSRRVSLL